MPMPSENTPWPPKSWADAYAQYNVNNAWYLGDVDELERIYAMNASEQPDYMRNGSPRKGGLVGVASRMFWGRPVEPGQSRSKLHIPAPADLATLASDLQYSDPPEVQLQVEQGSGQINTKAQDRLDVIMNSEQSHAMYNAMGELKAALGAVVIVPRWDTSLEDHVWLDYVGADCAIPVFRQGRLAEVTLWTEYIEGHVYYRHLEHHAPGYIEHALFKGNQQSLGRRVPLEEREETQVYASIVGEDSQYKTGIETLTAGYLPNLPTMAWRRKGVLRHAGRSDFAQQLPLFDALDDAFSSWMRDLKLGAGRMVVPQEYLHNLGPGAGAAFDVYQEVFTPINMPGKVNEVTMEAHQFEIRFEAHERTVKGIYNEILRKAGYSPASWGDTGSSISGVTATEIQQRTEQSERTRQKKNLYDKQVLSKMAAVALELDGLLFPGNGGGKLELTPTVVFPELSRVDPKTEADTVAILKTAGFISTWQGVARANPEWDEDMIAEEVQKIEADASRRAALAPAIPDPTTLGLDEDDPMNDEIEIDED